MSYLATITPLDQRISMGNKILQPLEDIGRLTIIAETEVLCIEIENRPTRENAKRRVATGVRVRDRSGVERIIQPKNGGSIVLSCGAFYSPCILARSGLGNGDVYNSSM
jgi:choline dehydrogenase-like flavoprotein